MKAADLKRFRTALIRAANKHIRGGHKIISYMFHNLQTGDMCPIGSLVGEEPQQKSFFIEGIAKKYHMSQAEIWYFVAAFDDIFSTHARQDPLSELGRELRKRYIDAPGRTPSSEVSSENAAPRKSR